MESFVHRRDQKFDSIIYYCFSRSFLVVLPWKSQPSQLNNRNTRKRCKRCRFSDAFTIDFEYISHYFLATSLLTLNIFHTFSSNSNIDFE